MWGKTLEGLHIQELEIRCELCGNEDFTVRSTGDASIVGVSITCDCCQACSSGNFRSDSVSEESDEEEEGGGQGQKGRIYFIAGPAEDDPVKIGFTGGRVADRARALQTGNPIPLLVLAEMEGSLRLERRLHEMFDGDRVGGEWFKRTPKLMAAIRVLS
jgi:hypothetical protein